MAVNNLKQRSHFLAILSIIILLSGNLVGERELSLLYFSVSFGTLLFQLVCCTLIALTEVMPLKKCRQLIWFSAFLNLGLAVFVFCVLQYPIPHFWYEPSIDIDWMKQIEVVLGFSTFYIISAMILVYTSKFIRHWLRHQWLWFRLLLVIAVSLFVDMILVSALLVYFANDAYLATWKILSIFSVKILLSLLSLPVCYFLVRIHAQIKGGELNKIIPTNKISA